MFPGTLAKSIRLAALALLTLTFAAVSNAAEKKVASFPPGAPTTACAPSGARDFAGLRVFNGTAPVPRVYACGSDGNPAGACFTQSLDVVNPEDYQGDLIAPGPTQGAWSCALVGSWAGWVPTDRLAPVPDAPAITTQQWLGTWVSIHVGARRDRLVLTRSAAGRGRIHVEGKAYFTNAAHAVNLGDVSGEALAMGPFLHIVDSAEKPDCVLDLKYDVRNDTFRAVDNGQCGGRNVSFDGIWRRATSKR